MISHLDHIVLTVADVEKAVSFYETTLKMEAISFGEGRRGVRFGNQKINFQSLGDEVRNHAMEGSGDLCLVSDWAMEEVIAYLKGREVNLLEGPVAKSGAQGPMQSVYFNDPDNNLIEVSVYLKDKPTSDTTDKSDKQGADNSAEDIIPSTAKPSSASKSSTTKSSSAAKSSTTKSSSAAKSSTVKSSTLSKPSPKPE